MKTHFRKKIIWLCLLIGLLWSNVILSSVNQITNLRLQSTKAGARLVFDATMPVKYHLFGLDHPDRLVIDIQKAALGRSLSSSLFKGTPIKDARTSVNKNNQLRIVFDLNYRVKAKAFLLEPSGEKGYRLVLDLARLQPKMVAAASASPSANQRPRYLSHYQAPHAKGPNLATSKPSYKEKERLPTAFVASDDEPKRPADVIIVIDPGHGGKDPGATGARGTHEKTVVLEISKALQKDINRQPGFKAYLTRTGDYYLTLRQRLAIARRYQGDMFIAIHADAYRNRSARGASVYALSSRGVTSEAARWLASKENESELMGGVTLTDKTNLLKSVLINLSQTATIRASLNIGERIIQSLSRVGRLHHARVEQAAFVVLKSPDIPSLLVETGFISNHEEEKKLRSKAYRAKMANAIMQGIRSYFIQSPPRNTWLAKQKFSKEQSTQHYRVKSGDTLSEIAFNFGVSLRNLKKINHIKGNDLRIGQVLLIPH